MQMQTVSASAFCITGLRLRHQLEDPSLRVVGQQVDRAVRTLTHVAKALARRLQVLQETLFADHAIALHRQAHEVGAPESADEHAVLPRREEFAGVEDHAARRDVRIPVVHRLLHARLLLDAAGDRRALILDAVGDRRPAIVLAFARDVHFIAAARAVFDLPQLAGLWMESRRLDVAVTEGPDLRPHAFLADERIVLRYGAVGVDAHELADQAVHLLRLHAAGSDRPIAEGDEQRAIAIPHQTATEVQW